MADNDYDPAGSTQMFRAFVDETPAAPQAPGSVSTYGRSSSSSSGGGNRTGVIALVAVIVLAVLGGVIWLAVK
ncbi:hypothetical protein ACIPLC_02840 [Kitasatospora sp. NPDC086801]|uniref:hypothetical protein n=1 Tax=Kitasatospora sp. NPDC086801 TaxID=3364066 RepID=UPI00381D0381